MQLIGKVETQYYSWPVKHNSTAIADGALLMAGATADTDLGVLVVAATAGADAMGILQGRLATSVSDTLVNGTVWNRRQVCPVFSAPVVRSEYDQTDTAAVASNSSTTLTITSLEDNIDTSWAYAVSGTGAGELSFLVASASGSATQKTAMGWASDTTVIKILRLFHQLAKLNTAADKIGTDAAAGSWTCLIIQNYIKNTDRPFEILDPTVHDNLSGLSTSALATKFYADVLVRNAGNYTLE